MSRKDILEMFERGYQDANARKFLERFWCKAHKCGCRVPEVDTIITMIDNIMCDATEEGEKMEMCVHDVQLVHFIVQGLVCLGQLALVKERM